MTRRLHSAPSPLHPLLSVLGWTPSCKNHLPLAPATPAATAAAATAQLIHTSSKAPTSEPGSTIAFCAPPSDQAHPEGAQWGVRHVAAGGPPPQLLPPASGRLLPAPAHTVQRPPTSQPGSKPRFSPRARLKLPADRCGGACVTRTGVAVSLGHMGRGAGTRGGPVLRRGRRWPRTAPLGRRSAQLRIGWNLAGQAK